MRTLLQIALLAALLPAAAPAEKGALRIESQPGVEVEWEGVVLGETDGRGVLLIRDIPPGEYRLTLRKAGFRSETARVSVTPGEMELALRLEPIPPPPPQKPPEPVRAAPAAPPPRPAAPEPTETPAEPKPPAETEPVPEPVPEIEPAPAELETEPEPPMPELETDLYSSAEQTADRPDDSAPGPLAWVLPTARGVALLGVMTLALLLAFALWSRLRTRQAHRIPSRKPRGRKPSKRERRPPQTASKQSSWFLEELRQREASSSSEEAAKARPREKEVIEVTDFEIMEEDT